MPMPAGPFADAGPQYDQLNQGAVRLEPLMNTDILTPKDLFQKEVRYTIPTFQRPYVWSQDDRWEPFWEDVRNVAEDYLDELERADNNDVEATQQTSPHFLGAVVLQQVPTGAKHIDRRDVIDGQQRVTTLQLLLDAVQQTCEDADEPCLQGAAMRLSRLVSNDERFIANERHHVFKLWPTRSDREAFRHAMDNGLAAKDFEESLIVEAHEFFQLQVRRWLEDGPGSMERRIDALEAAVTELLQMVVIDLGPRDDPNLIFETLNARGTPLEQSDLIKNFVLSQRGGEEGEIWGNLDDGWWRDEVRQGRQYRPRLDMLLNYWLAMRTGTEVSPSRVFDAFRDYAGDDVETVMTLVKQDLANYRAFETTGGVGPEEKSFYYHIDVMQAGVITPVLLLLLSADEHTRVRALDALESFLVRRMICRQTTKDYNKLVLELASRLQDSGLDRADTVTAGFLSEQTAYAREWPSDESVAAALGSSPLYRLLSRGRLRLVLEGIEHELRSSGKTEHSDVPRNLTIEHLLPVGWGPEKWPLSDGVDSDPATHRRNTLLHSIGNLTLATQKLNSSMSNDAWECKREELQEHSVLLLNNELLGQPSWSEDTIESRSQRMAELVWRRWPGPDSPKWADIS